MERASGASDGCGDALNTQNTRIFSFGVGDDVNAQFLDALSDNSRAISTYVRESEDIEAKVSSLYAKISNPVLTNLKLTISDNRTIAISVGSAVRISARAEVSGGIGRQASIESFRPIHCLRGASE